MIKKYLLGLGIVVLGFLGFSDAKVQDVGLLKYPSEVNQNFSIGFIKGGGVITDFLGTNKEVVGLDTDRFFWWATNGMPYVYLKSDNRAPLVQGFYDRFYSCDALTTIDTLPTNCQLGGMIDYSGDLSSVKEIFKNFFSNVVADDLVYYKYFNNQYIGATYDYWNNGLDICWSSEIIGKSLCFRGGLCSSSNTSPCGGSFVNSQNLSDLSFGNISLNWLGKAPGQVGYGNSNFNPGEIEDITGDIYEVPTDIDRYIEYYESKYGWDENVCYVGTDDLTGAYGKPGLSFQYGSGATMFSLYHLIYGTFGQSPVQNVGKFLNCWLINYNQWWDTISDERSYFCTDNGPETNISLSYDVSVNPFKNNRAAIYFLIDNLYNHQYRIDTSFPMFESSMGDQFAFYCAAKLNYENYKNGTLDFSELENQIDPILKDIIGDWNNRNLGSQYGFSVPNMSGNDNIWGNLIQTGSGIPDDLNPSGLFKQFYDRINSLLQNFSPRVAFGFIPLWILYPMLFLILFRIFRH